MVGAQGYTSIGARVSWGWLCLAEVHGWHALESCGCSGWWTVRNWTVAALKRLPEHPLRSFHSNSITVAAF